MWKIFKTPRGRTVLIKIAEDYILFYHDLTRPEVDVDEFYSIPVDEWISDRTERLDRGDNWHTHMDEKSWFTLEMKTFIDKNISNKQ